MIATKERPTPVEEGREKLLKFLAQSKKKGGYTDEKIWEIYNDPILSDEEVIEEYKKIRVRLKNLNDREER